MLNKVPEITIFFWIIKVLCTTVGETAADFLNDHIGLGLTGTSIVMSVALIAALWVPVSQRAICADDLLDFRGSDQCGRDSHH